ncbi:MAG: sugar ABC transporter ATP-binding protein [Candidatus Atribacteria bacterium]|nr:sugar ABC transporter ATP-binding protein [Candidatus Atribacteria bacterium]
MPDLLYMEKINKSFFGVKVLNDVSFRLQKGEVHVILGENGAGKSTLIKILSGAYTLDTGKIFIEGKEINMGSYGPEVAAQLGVSTIYQNFHLVPHLTVAENISLSNFPGKRGFISWKTVGQKAKTVLDDIHFSLDPNLPVKKLSVSQKQMLEIAIALSKNARIIIMDEPTAAISKREVETLFQLIEEIKKKGVGIIYISHKLEEIRIIGDTITVLRDGRDVGTLSVQNVDLNEVVNLMIGKEVKSTPRTLRTIGEEPFFQCDTLSISGSFHNISFTVHKGEILGLTGLVGSGKTELARAIFGIDRFLSGEISLNHQSVHIVNPKKAVQYGIGYLPEDRDVSGLCLNMPVKDNITLVFLAKLKSLIFSTMKERKQANQYIGNLKIKVTDMSQQVKYLSGGNKQKVIFAKWLAAHCQFLVLDEPTIGIDVGAREEIYNLIYDFVKTGHNAVLFISSDIPEILTISDRILVMSRGQIVSELDPHLTTKQEVMTRCLNLK